jgi:hypothetical protein
MPRIMEITYSTKLIVYLPTIRTSIGKVVSELDELYTLITGQKRTSDGSNQLLRLNVKPFLSQLKDLQKTIQQKGEVAGVSTEQRTYFDHYAVFGKISEFASNLKKSKQFGNTNSRVLGVQIAAENTAQVLQLAQNQTNTAIQATQDATKQLNEMRSYLITKKPERPSTPLAEALQKLQVTGEEVSKYYSEMYKTARFYHVTTSVDIELNPLLVSWLVLLQTLSQTKQPELSLGKVEELHSTLQKIQVRLIELDGDLPQGIENLHTDNKKIITLLMQNMDEIKQAIKSQNFTSFVNSIQSLSESVDPIVLRAKTFETSFWQNNMVFKKHTALVTDLRSEEDSLNKAIIDSKLPPLVN